MYLQEHLLLSVMPAYIAAEVKRSLMLKMTDSYSAQQRQTAQFQDLFVQRHSNVRSQAAGDCAPVSVGFASPMRSKAMTRPGARIMELQKER